MSHLAFSMTLKLQRPRSSPRHSFALERFHTHSAELRQLLVRAASNRLGSDTLQRLSDEEACAD